MSMSNTVWRLIVKVKATDRMKCARPAPARPVQCPSPPSCPHYRTRTLSTGVGTEGTDCQRPGPRPQAPQPLLRYHADFTTITRNSIVAPPPCPLCGTPPASTHLRHGVHLAARDLLEPRNEEPQRGVPLDRQVLGLAGGQYSRTGGDTVAQWRGGGSAATWDQAHCTGRPLHSCRTLAWAGIGLLPHLEVEQVVYALVVYLQVRGAERVLGVRLLGHGAKQVLHGAGDDAVVRVGARVAVAGNHLLPP